MDEPTPEELARLRAERDEAERLLSYAASRSRHANCELALRRGWVACSECTFDRAAAAYRDEVGG